jgi:periplasmic protein TonB
MEIKKNPKLDYRRKSGLFFNIGLVVSLLMAITAFEWKFPDNGTKVDVTNNKYVEEVILVPITSHATPPPPKVVPVILNEVPDDIEVAIEDIKITFDQHEVGDIEPVVIDLPEPDIETEPEVFDIVESMPKYVGGMGEFYKFVGENLKYPSQARRIGVGGKVFVHFIVDKDGTLSNIKIARGIGAGCDEEVLRILAMSPNWIPGKQRGNPVRVRMMLPITFRLQ